MVYGITKMNSFRTLKEWINELQARGAQDIAIAIGTSKSSLFGVCAASVGGTFTRILQTHLKS